MTLLKLLGGVDLTTMLGGAVHLQLADLHSPILCTDVLNLKTNSDMPKDVHDHSKLEKIEYSCTYY